MKKTPVVVITGQPPWTESAIQILQDQGFEYLRYEESSGYVARLADDLAAMVLVDGDADDWQIWTTMPKANQATRRIPVIVVAADDVVRGRAGDAGADVTLHPDFLNVALPGHLDLARHRGTDEQELLENQCDEPLPPVAMQGIRKFNAGEYYKQHDAFEERWFAEDGPVRDLYQGILQVGVAYFQITQGNHRGALKLLLRSTQWLLALPDVCQGVDVEQLREDSTRVRAELERMAPSEIGQFDRSLLKPVRLVPTEVEDI